MCCTGRVEELANKNCLAGRATGGQDATTTPSLLLTHEFVHMLDRVQAE